MVCLGLVWVMGLGLVLRRVWGWYKVGFRVSPWMLGVLGK